jgi:hypothetical protein
MSKVDSQNTPKIIIHIYICWALGLTTSHATTVETILGRVGFGRGGSGLTAVCYYN